jgi:ParB-like chromosome segregation protein Spo0J
MMMYDGMIMIIKTSQEYASLVPQLSTEEYESLKQSIKENGLWFPIVVNKGYFRWPS